MNNTPEENIRGLCAKLANLTTPDGILRLLFRLCTESELTELGMRFKADRLVQEQVSIDEILNAFPGRADVVAKVLIHQTDKIKKRIFLKKR